MHAQLITYQLKDISQAEYLKQMVEPDAPVLAKVPGLVSKVWLTDEEKNTFGGFYLVLRGISGLSKRMSDETTEVTEDCLIDREGRQGRLPVSSRSQRAWSFLGTASGRREEASPREFPKESRPLASGAYRDDRTL